MKYTTTILLAVLALSGCDNSKNHKGAATVIDGDTIKISGQSIRLFGIDAPERSQPYGSAATMALRDKIGSGPVSCLYRVTDRYGRYVAVCRANGVDLGEWMVAQGHAAAYRKYSLSYVVPEMQARADKLGMWATNTQMPWEYRAEN